jgi:hypothetical protein
MICEEDGLLYAKSNFLVSEIPDFVPEPDFDWNELCVGRVIYQFNDMITDA